MLVTFLWLYLHGLTKNSVFCGISSTLSFWVDLHHQADDEDCEEEDFSFHEALLEMRLDDPTSAHADSQRICLPFRSIRVTALVFILTIAFAVLMWIGMGNDFIDSPSLATVAGLAVVSVICFTSSAFVALFTQIPILYHCQKLDYNGLVTSLLLILYYFIGSSVPSAFILWIMRELPPAIVPDVHEESRTIAYITDTSVVAHIPQRWTTATSLQNQVHFLVFS
ncbi:hypothetical protein GH714_028377 [Hevea brasiliensis]|uniref:THH1/TOM1/TOM3 domain-containing protein n=1 Tax=Hevea brasiliensis TaxID=3981 RepID=A0A6A6MNU0_HEVBR|nr:hypothetical protein GH714_028377 [Hevea brasiliensis]